jgi:signal transduction histidine kinase
LLHIVNVIRQSSAGITPVTLTHVATADPIANVILVTTGFVVVGALGAYLLHEFDSRLADLQALVISLEQRVTDRTHDLEIAKTEAETARAAAEEANAVKSRFLANMSHELRTPLNAILNFTAFVADGVMGPVNSEQADVLNQALGSGKHLLSLINDVLDITKIESGMMDLFVQDVDMNAVLATTISVAKGLVKDKSLDLVTDVDEDLPVTYGDRRRIRQVFLNLVSNAIKFTNKGSVTITAKRAEGGIEVMVKDTGIGIAPEDQHLVFESFRQVQKHDIEAVGTGLGLPISKHFVQVHGGRMWFESVAGAGTIFYVYLPTLTEPEAEALSKAAISESE